MSTLQKTKIVCPIDFDANSLVALDLARAIVREHAGTLYLLHVVSVPDPLVISAPFMIENAEEYARIQLDEIARDSLNDVQHHIILKMGRPAQQIIEFATEVGADLIVIATRGRTGASRFVLGSVAEKVVREAPCPVLTTRGRPVSEPTTATAARASS